MIKAVFWKTDLTAAFRMDGRGKEDRQRRVRVEVGYDSLGVGWESFNNYLMFSQVLHAIVGAGFSGDQESKVTCLCGIYIPVMLQSNNIR